MNLARKINIECSTDYEAVILTPKQTAAILRRMRQPERTITLLAGATGLQFSEIAGLQWQDIDYTHERIHVRRTWIDGKISEKMKTKQSRSAVPMATELAQVLREWHGSLCMITPLTESSRPAKRMGGLRASEICSCLIICGPRQSRLGWSSGRGSDLDSTTCGIH